VAEGGEPFDTASLALPETDRTALVDLLQRYGRSHPTGTTTILDHYLVPRVRLTSRTPTHRLPREPVIVAVQPVSGPSVD
jgi:hypothetical protein